MWQLQSGGAASCASLLMARALIFVLLQVAAVVGASAISSSPSPTSSLGSERRHCQSSVLSRNARRARARGKLKANALHHPQHWVRSDDPAHPKMRMPVDLEDAHSVNIMPENSFWKDHDSDQDEGHPNWTVERLLDMSSEELSQDVDRTMENAGFDLRRWTDRHYAATITKYNLQDLESAKHLCPKLYFEPRGSSEEEDFAEMLLERGENGSKVPTIEEPFCMHCQSLLGAPIPAQGLGELADDAHCRWCGFMNPHAPDGTLLTDAQVHVVEMEPSTAGYLADQQAAAAERFMADVNQLDDLDQGLASARPTTEQRCQECGFKTAYYWTRQVRGADEGQTAFFECVRCGEVWNIK